MVVSGAGAPCPQKNDISIPGFISALWRSPERFREYPGPIQIETDDGALTVIYEGGRVQYPIGHQKVAFYGEIGTEVVDCSMIEHIGGNFSLCIVGPRNGIARFRGLENLQGLMKLELVTENRMPNDGMPVRLNSLAGIEYCHRLRVLYMPHQALTDLSLLADLPIKRLIIHNNQVADLSPIAGLPLEVLDIEYNPVSDLRPLAGCPLRMIKIGKTSVRSLDDIDTSKLQTLSIDTDQLELLKKVDFSSLTKLIIVTDDRLSPEIMDVLMDVNTSHPSVRVIANGRQYEIGYHLFGRP